MGISPSGRFQVVENNGTKARLFSPEGIRWKTAWVIIAAVGILCLAILLADLVKIGTSSRSLAKVATKISVMSGKNEQLQTRIAANEGDISVCTEAVKLNLVSGNGVRAIVLTAPQDANITISATNQR